MSETPFTDWVRERPEVVQRLIVDWPPEASVIARPGREFFIPAPGVIGRVASWHEDGYVGVEAPSPYARRGHGGAVVHSGTLLRAAVHPRDLVIVAFATFGETVLDHVEMRRAATFCENDNEEVAR